jgi:hypothetical protein
MILFGVWLVLEVLIAVLLLATQRLAMRDGRGLFETVLKTPGILFSYLLVIAGGLFAVQYALDYEVTRVISDIAQNAGFVPAK